MIRAFLVAVCLCLLAGPSAAQLMGGAMYRCQLKVTAARGVHAPAMQHIYEAEGGCEEVDLGSSFRRQAHMTLRAVWDPQSRTFNERATLEGQGGGEVKSQFKCSEDPYLRGVFSGCTVMTHQNSTLWTTLSNQAQKGRPIGERFVNAKEAIRLSKQAPSGGSGVGSGASKAGQAIDKAPPQLSKGLSGGKPPPNSKTIDKIMPKLGGAVLMEQGVDRPGSDYHGFQMTQAKPVLCQQACNNDARCRAWTYVKPGIKGPKAACFLKDRIPLPRKDACCVSGHKPKPKLAPPKKQGSGQPSSNPNTMEKAVTKFGGALGGMEQGVDRPGGDYHGFPMGLGKPEQCREACKSDTRCRAWTHVKPGIKGPQAVCFLKNQVPPPRKDACCVSGVKKPKLKSPKAGH